jgi:hypothetical protein
MDDADAAEAAERPERLVCIEVIIGARGRHDGQLAEPKRHEDAGSELAAGMTGLLFIHSKTVEFGVICSRAAQCVASSLAWRAREPASTSVATM